MKCSLQIKQADEVFFFLLLLFFLAYLRFVKEVTVSFIHQMTTFCVKCVSLKGVKSVNE